MDLPINEKCPTGIEGLDDILGGGLPTGCFYLVQGDPGSGKTTLALQFLMEGLRRGESAFYITLSETREELITVALSHAWSLDQIPLLELSELERILGPERENTIFHPSEVELDKLTGVLVQEMARSKPLRVVFDSLSEYRLMAETSLKYRRSLLRLKQEFAKFGSTVLLLDDKMDRPGQTGDPHVLSLTHGVIQMEQDSPDYGVSRRRLRIVKMRGIKYREGYHDYVIEKGGLKVFPRLVASEHHADFKREPVSSGIKELDQLFGGGLDRGTTTLLLGPAGTGKSTLALQFAARMAEKGEKSMVFAFDETMEIMIRRAEALGLPLRKYMDNGTISVRQMDPAELLPGEFAVRVRKGVEAGCKGVVIDSLNGYLNAMPGERYLYNQLHELTAYLNRQGVVTVMVMAQHGLGNALEAPVDLSYLCDMLVNLRYFEAQGRIRQSVAAIKKRSGYHEKTIREFRLEPMHGVRIGDPLQEFQGLLTGAPRYYGSAERMMDTGAGK